MKRLVFNLRQRIRSYRTDRRLTKLEKIVDESSDLDWLEHVQRYFPKNDFLTDGVRFWSAIKKWFDHHNIENDTQLYWVGLVFSDWISQRKKDRFCNIGLYDVPIQSYIQVYKNSLRIPYRSRIHQSLLHCHLELQCKMSDLLEIQGGIDNQQCLKIGFLRAKHYDEYPEWFENWKTWIRQHYQPKDSDAWPRDVSWKHDYVVRRYRKNTNSIFSCFVDIDLHKTVNVLLYDHTLPTRLHAVLMYWCLSQVIACIDEILSPDPFTGNIEMWPQYIHVHIPDSDQYRPLVRCMISQMLKPYIQKDLTIDPIFTFIECPNVSTPSSIPVYVQQLANAQDALDDKNRIQPLEF